ncbi:hypothetical protein OIV83_004616 [Microbotryomycetes sp. JL201]|nr:hypothetical protein OIV83_004616 [Microbotryomycetes sp. JL201]
MSDELANSAPPSVDGTQIKFKGRLPGDAMSDEHEQDAEASLAQQAPVPSTSSAPPTTSARATGEQPIVTLKSVSSDGQRSREFHAKYFRPVLHDQPLREMLDLPESYFQPTASELQQAFAGQVRKREQLTDAPLLTSKLREREEATSHREKARRWPHTRIRIKFADRSQLEGVFPSTDKLVHVYEFVRLAVDERHRDHPFVLYQSPPRREFVRGAPEFKGKSLMDLQLTPSSVFYIKFSEDALNGKRSTSPPGRSRRAD